MTKIFHSKPWTPKIREAANALTRKIHQAAPELEVLFMGAAALGLPGKNDIDLDILCDEADIQKYTTVLVTILGQPKSTKNNLTAWEYKLGEFEVDAILSDPKTSHVPIQKKRFEVLRSNPILLAEYKKLKEECDGLPYEDYEKRKVAFLKKVA